MTTVKMTIAEARKAARIDTAKLKATTEADIERQAKEDGTDDFRPFSPDVANVSKKRMLD